MMTLAGQRTVAVERLSVASTGARRRGRPPGSKNKPKSVISLVEVKSLRAKLAPYLPTEDLTYLIGTLEGTESPTLQRDLDIFLALQLKAVLPALADEIKGGNLLKETTSRSSVVKELLALRFQMEKQDKGDERTNQYTFIQNVFNQRGLDSERLASFFPGPMEPATQDLPRLVSGTPDGDAGDADEARAVSGEVSIRPLEVPTGGEEPTDWVQLAD